MLADRRYDTDAIINIALQADVIPVTSPKKIAKLFVSTTNIFTNFVILSKMPFCISRNGMSLLHIMPKTVLTLALQLEISALLFDKKIIDNML